MCDCAECPNNDDNRYEGSDAWEREQEARQLGTYEGSVELRHIPWDAPYDPQYWSE